jgi:replication factor A1
MFVGILQKRVQPSRRLAFSGRSDINRVEKMRQKRSSMATFEYLAFLSAKHNIHPEDLFQGLVLAREHEKSSCQNLQIEYRGSAKLEAVFLITKESKVIGQFRVPEELLKRVDVHFESWMDTDKIRKQINKQKMAAKPFTVVQDLRHGMKKVNVEAEVLEASTPSRVFTQYGNSATITNALIADETGSVKLCLWNEQASDVRKGDTVQIKNAKVSTYKGARQLNLGKGGSISVLNHTK